LSCAIVLEAKGRMRAIQSAPSSRKLQSAPSSRKLQSAPSSRRLQSTPPARLPLDDMPATPWGIRSQYATSVSPSSISGEPLGGPLASFCLKEEEEMEFIPDVEDRQIIAARRFRDRLAAVIHDEKRYREFQQIMKVGMTHMSLKENLERILRQQVARELDEEKTEQELLEKSFGGLRLKK
jgi:hypothetical protein